ncbi:MAG: hypothetical protein FWD31_14190, partial [Planctomycetaceae bacterium]|nr:hypothetical protein [Planctomycetaceae bacterium]
MIFDDQLVVGVIFCYTFSLCSILGKMMAVMNSHHFPIQPLFFQPITPLSSITLFIASLISSLS